jgi:exopolysaccharide production protein ExoZ
MQQLLSIHYLRAVAAMMVVIFHIYQTGHLIPRHIPEMEFLTGGVDIFFVISGFVMVRSTQGREITPIQFLTTRVQRIVPLYWIATLAAAVSIQGEWLRKIASFFFIPVINPEDGLLQPIVEAGWTLNYEMFFYLLFAVTLLLTERHRIWAVGGVLLGLVLLGWNNEPGSISHFYARPIMLEFFFGMLIAQYNIKCPAIMVPIGFGLMYLLLPILSDRALSLGLPAALIVAGVLSAETKLPSWKLPSLIGDASYSIYLFHIPPLAFVVMLSRQFSLSGVSFGILALALILVVSIGIHIVIEKPIIRYFGRLKMRNKAEAQPLPARS